MRWVGRRQSANVEDRRGMPGGRVAMGGMGTLLLLLVSWCLLGDPLALVQQQPGGPQINPQDGGPQAPLNPEEEQLRQFVAVVLAETEDVWNAQFRQAGIEYREPTLVLFTGQVQSACGRAGASVGPFYCPEDEKIYLDLSFFADLRDRHGAAGDFAQAYVIAHEVGHHVQKQIGTLDEVHRLQARMSKEEGNALSVRLELQADFYAGVWAHHADRTNNIVEEGDIEEALQAANAIGDDRLQQEGQGYVVPDSFTHGTSAQRVEWFRRGFETGDMRQGDTFNAGPL